MRLTRTDNVYEYRLSPARIKRGKATRNFTVTLNDGRVVCSGFVSEGRFFVAQTHITTPPRAEMIRELIAAGADLSNEDPPIVKLPAPPPLPREERDTVPPIFVLDDLEDE